MKQRKRLLLALAFWMTASAMSFAQLDLEVTVHCSEPGTLFVKIMEKIEELGELSDISELTVTGKLNRDDCNVINNQIKNLVLIDLGGVTCEGEFNLNLNGRSRLTTAVLPPNLTTLTDGCFEYCTSLESITLPDGITTLSHRAFRGCSKLNSIHLPASLTTIKTEVFDGCAFTSFTLPPGVKIDGKNAFSGNSKLESFTFSDGIDGTEMGTYTFNECRQLHHIRLPEGVTEIPDGFLKNTDVADFEIPQTVRKIGYQAFFEVNSPKRIVIPDSVTSIGSQCFYLSHIEEVVWPKGCTTMNSDMFRYCYDLHSVTLPETLDSLSGYGHFLNCVSLKSIHLPEGIRTLKGGALGGCSNLEEVNIPKACTYIEGSFQDCRKLTHIDIPDAVTFIGNSSFSGCPLEYEELKLPSKLRVIGDNAFAGGKYKKVVVPEGCINIGHNAFYSGTLTTLDLPSTLLVITGPLPGTTYNSVLETVTMRSLIPPYVRKSDMFTGSDNGRPTLRVPAVSLAMYQADNRFSGADTIVAISGYTPATNVLNIVGDVTLTADCGLNGVGKYDVNFFQQQLNRSMMNGNFDSDHPRLTIEKGATLHAGTITMTCDRHDNHYGTYTWDAFINRGTCTADRIDLRWRMKDMDYYCPSFDTRMSDIIPEREGTPLIFYRYDTNARAVGNFGGTWVRLASDDMLRAGQGYLIRTQPMIAWWDDYYSRWEYNYLYTHHISHPGGKDFFTTAADVALPMTHAAGEFEHNKNWNLVGQPYPAFFDIRGIDYDGPVLLPTGSRWKAVSPLDDEVVLEPMMAFFVQVPDGVSSITLQADRRQLGPKFVKDATVNSPMNLRRADKNSQRVVFDVTLQRQSEEEEEPASTRFVINPEATTRYDIGRDAPAMSSDSCALLYSWQNDGGVAYAINERPLGDGIIRLGLQIVEAGTYTLSMNVRGAAFPASEDVWLIDNETGTRTVISQDAYTFTISEPTTLTQRFVIAISDAEPTAIEDCVTAVPKPMEGIFNLSGQRISEPRKGLYISNGRIVMKK